jgi:hypothetical protein
MSIGDAGIIKVHCTESYSGTVFTNISLTFFYGGILSSIRVRILSKLRHDKKNLVWRNKYAEKNAK